MRLNKVSFALFLILIVQGFSWAQEREVTGTVRDASGTEMMGVAVVVKGEQHGVQTDFNGRYSIKVAPGKTLEFSFLGMKTQNRKVGTSGRIDVVMQEEAQVIDEVIVTGYMQTKKDAVSAGVTTIGSENLSKLNPSTSVDNMLQGKAVGVDVTALNGKPGQTAYMKVRGAVSLNVKGGDKSQPLYVVDGVFVDKDDMNILNPNDIESMSVLKDASATALYGSRGANGVVLITTKQGKKGRTKFTYTARTGFGDKTPDPFEMMNAEEKIRYEEAVDPNTYRRTADKKERLISYDNDWKKNILKTTFITSHMLSASGASEDTNYFISGGWDKNTGILKYLDGFNRYTARLNLNTKMTDKVKFGFTSSLSQTKTDEPRDRYNQQNPFAAMYWYNPYENIYERDENTGQFIKDKKTGEYVYEVGSQVLSIIEALQAQPDVRKNTQLLASAFASYDITPALTFTTRYSANYKRYKREYYVQPGSILDQITGSKTNPGSKLDSGSDNYNYTWLNQLTYLKSFGKHNVNATLFTEYTDNYYHSYYLNSKGYMSKFLTTQDNGAKPENVETTKSESAMFSVAAALNYDYNEKYSLTGSVRRDGASRFGKDNRYGNFWSVGAGWDIAKEEFMKSAEWLNRAKLTVSYGTTGNWDIPNYAAKGYYLSTSYGDFPAAVFKSSIANSNLTWETQKSFNVGAELAAFSNRLSVTGSYFTNTREDFLFEIPHSWEEGGYTQYVNTGNMKNSGIELSVSGDVIKTPNFKWNLGANITFMNYNIESLGDGRDDLTVGNSSMLKVGELPFVYYMKRYAGVDPANGDALYYQKLYDRNGNETGELKTTNNYKDASQFVLSGKSPFAKQFGGFNTSFVYKGIDLNADFSFKLGNYIYNQVAQDLLSDGANVNMNQRKDALDYWKNPGDNKLPRLDASFNQSSDRFLQDGSYLRFRTLSLGYTFPKDAVNGLGLRIFVQGQNLYTWTKFEGDPEVSIGAAESQLRANQEFISGEVYLYSYPTLRTFSMGLDLTF